MEEEKIIFVRRMIEGDEKAFDELYHAYSKKLYRMAYFITGNKNGNHSDSEDILQETFVKCYLHRKELKNLGRFESWICQILVRTAWKTEKKKKRAGEISYEEILEQEEDSGSRMARQMREDLSAVNPLDACLQKESFTELGEMVKQLDIKYRTVILLYYYNDYGTKEIARIMGIFEGTVKSRLSRARTLLHQQMERDANGSIRKNRQNNRVKGAVS